MSEPYDTVFSLPSVDDDPDTEIGVLLMGLLPDRLLAGLGVAALGLAPDPAGATMLVDQLRHGARPDLTFSDALAAGAERWRSASEGLAASLDTGSRSAALRRLWASAAADVDAATRLRTLGAAERVYLVACWLRRAEISRAAEEHTGEADQCPT